MSGRTWSEEEVSWLRANYGKMGTKACAGHLGRTSASVKVKARTLGLSYDTYRVSWTPEEEAYLREHYADDITSDIAYELGKRLHWVHRKASSMGLRKAEDFMERNKRRIDSKRAAAVEVAREEGRIPALGSHYGARTQFKKGRKVPQEEIDKRTVTYFKTREAEKTRIRWNLPRKTRMRISNESVYGPKRK